MPRPTNSLITGCMAGADANDIAERYFEFLTTCYVDDDGKKRQHAPASFVETLREVHASYRPRYDLSACLAGTQKGFCGRVWFWSDLHFFHTGIIKYAGRPFQSAEEMNNALLANCLSRVSADDILVFGGDIMIGNLAGANRILRAIPGYKINVIGNHDIDANSKQPMRLAVDEVAACLGFQYQGSRFFVSHMPISEELLDADQRNIHGHIHRASIHPTLGTGERHLSICVENMAYAPALLESLLLQRR